MNTTSEWLQYIQEEQKYFNPDERLKTFKKWVFPNSAKCNAQKMADAGFVYTGNTKDPDSVQCFFCGKSLDGWEIDDDPHNEHIKHAPNCHYAQLQDDTPVIQLLSVWEEYTKKLVDRFHEKMSNKLDVLL